nr:hypothetical protein [Tanacetum cinerariifolium]
MSTRSSARNLFPPLDNPELTIRRRSRTDPTLLNNSKMAAEGNGDLPVPDLGTMEELCQPSLNVHNSFQFYGLPGDDANKHLDKFLHVTQSIKVYGFTDDALRLYLFPHSLTHHAIAWFDRLPRNSINTFEQMAKMFLGKYFPPSMVTKLRNEITNFHQRPDESLFEAWECYKLSIDRFHNHNMLPDTSAQRSESSSSITSFSDTKIAALKAKMAKINKNLTRVILVEQQVKAVTPSCKTSGGPHSLSDCPATVGNTQNVYATGAYQCNSYQPQGNRNLLSYRSDNYLGPPGFNQNQNRNNQNKNFHNQNRNQGNHNPQGNNQGRDQFFHGASHCQNPPPSYQAPAYQAPIYQASVHQPQIPQPQVVTTNEFTNFMKANDAILKNMQTNMTSLTNLNLELKNMFGQFMKMNTASSSGSGTLPAPIIEPVASPVSASKPNQRPSIPYPSRLHDQKLCDKANDQREKFFQIFKDLNFNISFDDALILMPKFGSTIKTLLTNKDKLSELNEHCSVVLLKKLPENLGDPSKFLIPCDFLRMVECLALANLGASINLMPLSVRNKLSLPDLSPTCMTLELADRLISRPVGVAEDVFIKVGTFHFPADFVVVDFDVDPLVPLILRRSFLKPKRALIYVFEEVLGYFDVITSGNPTPYCDPIVSTTSPTLTPFGNGDFLLEEVDAFIALEDDLTSPEVDQSYELKICEAKSDKSSIDEPPEVELKDLPPRLEYACLKGDDKLAVIIEKYLSVEEKTALITVLKSHRQAIAWKLSDIKGIDLEFYTHKILVEEDFKPGFNIIDGSILKSTMSSRMSGNEYYCFLDDFSGYFQIPVDLKDQEKPRSLVHMERLLTATCILGYAMHRARFRERMLKQCEDTNLCLNGEKSNFMVKEGIVLGHKISKNEIEVDKAKVDVIAKLPHPITVKDSPCLLVLITGTSQSRQHGITSLIQIEPCKSPTKSLFDVGSSRISIFTVNTFVSLGCSANYDQMTANKIDFTDMACEEYSQEVLGFSDVTILESVHPRATLNLIKGVTESIPEFDPSYYDPEGYILLLEAIMNSEPSPPFPNHEQSMPLFKKELKACEANTVKSSIDEPPEVKLKDLPPHLEYAFLEGDNKLPVIITKELGDEEKSALLKVLKSHKRAIAWKLSDIQEVEKLLDAGLIYPISDSPWVSQVHCMPKKGGFTVVENEENELILTHLVTRWRRTNTIVSSMVSLGIFKFPLTLVIRRILHSPAHKGRSPIVACLSVCAMHRARFKGVKERQEKDKIGSKPNKNGKHGEAQKSQSQSESREKEKMKKRKVKGLKMKNLTNDFLLFEETNAFLGLEDDPDSPELDPSYYDPEGDIQMLEAILNSDPAPSLPNHKQFVPLFTNELKACEAKTIKSSVDEPPAVELKDLPPHLEYAFIEGDNKLPIIIAKELGEEEKVALIKVLKSHKRAIAWKLFDIQGINSEFCTRKILMEECKIHEKYRSLPRIKSEASRILSGPNKGPRLCWTL